jgi:hypothetical protein
MAVASHAHTYTFKPGRVVEWFFDDIDLPDSTTNEAESHGFVKFRIRPVQPVLAGTLIENIANIYFDFNPPIITEPSLLVAEFSTGVGSMVESQVKLSPVPVTDLLNISASTGIRAIRIFAADGREVDHRSIQTTSGTIDLSALNAGAYLLVATMANGGSARERFIKH